MDKGGLSPRDLLNIVLKCVKIYVYFYIRQNKGNFVTAKLQGLWNHLWQPVATLWEKTRNNLVDYLEIHTVPRGSVWVSFWFKYDFGEIIEKYLVLGRISG